MEIHQLNNLTKHLSTRVDYFHSPLHNLRLCSMLIYTSSSIIDLMYIDSAVWPLLLTSYLADNDFSLPDPILPETKTDLR